MKLLSTLLSGRITAEEKLELIQEHGIIVTDDMKESVNTMCNLSQGILEEGLREGRKEGRAEGRKEGALDMLA